MRVALVLTAVLLLTAFAGCSSKPATTPASDQVDCTKTPDDPTCKVAVDDKTGAIKGVVTDAAIKPVAGVAIRINVGKTPLTATTTAAGTFAFSKVPPGTYFIQASKKGYTSTQTSVEVKAGVAPSVTKVLLASDPSSVPFVEAYTFDGYIECSVKAIVIGFAACSAPNIVAPGTTTDNFIQGYPVTMNITFAQSEMVWESTQAAGSAMDVGYIIPGTSSNFADNASASPAIVKASGDLIRKNVDIESGEELAVRVFTNGVDGSDPGAACPVCVGGAGATIEQKFTIYTFLFYGFRPAEDYSFAKTNEAPKPPA